MKNFLNVNLNFHNLNREWNALFILIKQTNFLDHHNWNAIQKVKDN